MTKSDMTEGIHSNIGSDY